MKKRKKFVMLMMFALVGMLIFMGMSGSVDTERKGNFTNLPVQRQIVLRLIDHLADPECDESAPASQPATAAMDHPLPDCWLVSEARTALEKNTHSEK